MAENPVVKALRMLGTSLEPAHEVWDAAQEEALRVLPIAEAQAQVVEAAKAYWEGPTAATGQVLFDALSALDQVERG